MDTLIRQILWAVGSIGGVAAIVAGLVKFFGERWAERIHEKWKHDLERDLEQFRADLNNQQEVLSHALASGSAGFISAQDQRLKAIQALWEKVLGLREEYGQSLMVWNVYSAGELSKISDFSGSFFINVPKDFEEFISKHPVDVFEPEKYRPFVGEKFWLLFFIYRAVTMRLAFRVSEGISKGRIPPWDREDDGSDDGVIQLLENVFSTEELEYVRKQSLGGPHLTLQLLENKMLAEAERRLSGSHAVDTWMAEGRRALELLKEVNEVTLSADKVT